MAKSRGAWLIGILFLFLAYYKIAPALEDGFTVASAGDGMGTIGFIYDANQHIKRHGLLSIFGGNYFSETMGGGLNIYGIPSSFLQRFMYWLLGFYSGKPDDVFDLLAGVAVWTIGICAYNLGRVVGLGVGMSALYAFMVYLLPNFHGKVAFHLTLAFLVGPLLVASTSISYFKDLSFKSLIRVVFANWLNFMIAEYYGYYGLMVSAAIVIPAIILNVYKKGGKVAAQVMASFALFFTLMAISFPQLIIARVMSSLTGEKNAVLDNFSRLDFEFTLHAIHNPLSLIQPNLPILTKSLPFWVSHDLGGEFIYRIGSVLTLGILLTMIGYIIRKYRYRSNDLNLFPLVIWAAFIATCFALRPGNLLSLVPLTKAIAPMFRVSIRSLIYTQIFLLLGFTMGLQYIWCEMNRMKRTPKWVNKTLSSALVLCISYLTIADISPVALSEGLSPLSLNPGVPNDPVASSLRKYPDGYLLELPFNYPGPATPESDYAYYTERIVHEKPIINGGIPYTGEMGDVLIRMAMVGRFNQAVPDFVETVRKLGIRYVGVRKDPRVDPLESFQKLDGLKVVVDGENHKVFEVQNPEPYSIQKLRKWVWQDPMTFRISTMASQISHIEDISINGDKRHYRRYLVSNVPVFAAFGPYVPLEPGSYEASFAVTLNSDVIQKGPEDVAIDIDVVSSAEGGLVARAIPIDELSGEKIYEVTIPFSMKQQGTMQVRIAPKMTGLLSVSDFTLFRKNPIHEKSLMTISRK